MNRRTLVTHVGAGIAAIALAGCTADGNGGGEDTRGGDNDETPTGTDSEAADDDETPTEIREAETRLTDASLGIVNAECGQQHDEAVIAFDDTGEVVVEGTIWGANLCKIPELVAADYDGEADELTVTVGTTERGGEDEEMACGECIAELDYRVSAVFDGGLPGSVSVVHDRGDGGQEVATSSQS
jgi:hypothetical protein